MALENLKELPKFIERQVPLLTHFQIVEALNLTIKQIMPVEVDEFSKNKLTELVDFQNKYGLSTPNLNALAQRLRLISRTLKIKNQGMTPFTFGCDFRPDMMHD